MNDAKQRRVVILLGPPGSGKGTQSKRLVSDLHIPHISTGDLFRHNISNHTELGKKAKGYMNAGNLVPDELVLEMLFDRVSEPDSSDGYLLDGFPRTIPQAEAFDASLTPQDKLVVINLNAEEEVVLRRLSSRVTCSGCGEVYNLNFNPPEKAGVCDKCGGELKKRSDDTPEVIHERLEVYNNQTEPLIAHYEKKGVLSHFDGSRNANELYKDIIALF